MNKQLRSIFETFNVKIHFIKFDYQVYFILVKFF